MNEFPPAEQDFAFALPLRWPDELSDRREYEAQIVSYARLMTPLLLASEGDETVVVLAGVRPLVGDLEALWSPADMPPEIMALLEVVRARET